MVRNDLLKMLIIASVFFSEHFLQSELRNFTVNRMSLNFLL